jgi:branched-chain amino acid transport system substrate-binding protein
VASLLALAGCGSGSGHQRSAADLAAARAFALDVGKAPSNTLTIYSSLSLRGADAANNLSVNQAEQLAVEQAHGRAGGFHIRFVMLDNSIPSTGTWDAATAAQDAREAAADRSAVAYLGDDTSGASAATVPILNRAGMLQVSPLSTADSLTAGGPTAKALDPSGRRTFARMVPSDRVQALAQALYQSQAGCRRVAVVRDGGVYGDNLAARVAAADAAQGISVVGNEEVAPGQADFAKLTSQVGGSGADCVFFGGNIGPHTVAMWDALGSLPGGPKLFGPDALGDASFTASIGPAGDRTFITSPGLAPNAYNDLGQRFYASYQARFGGFPSPEAIFGYEAMQAVLSSIQAAGSSAGSRADVVSRFFAIKNRQSVLGSYSIQPDGDTTLTSYGAYVVRNGDLVFSHVLRPSGT